MKKVSSKMASGVGLSNRRNTYEVDADECSFLSLFSCLDGCRSSRMEAATSARNTISTSMNHTTGER